MSYHCSIKFFGYLRRGCQFITNFLLAYFMFRCPHRNHATRLAQYWIREFLRCWSENKFFNFVIDLFRQTTVAKKDIHIQFCEKSSWKTSYWKSEIDIKLETNVVVEWLTLLLRILEIRVQISTQRQAILTEVSRGVFPVPPGEYHDSTLKLGHDLILPNPFQFVSNLSPFPSTLYRPELLKRRR
jgi:hypothetical protein